MHTTQRSHWCRLGVAAMSAGLLLSIACGGGEDGPKEYEIRAVDYAYEGLPDKIAAGSSFTLLNKSTVEVHEIYAARLPDSETRSVDELLQLPEGEQEALGAIDWFVLIALPGEEGQAVLGNGSFGEPGRYLLACFIPTGADPQALLAALESESEEEPDLGEGAPHFTRGMFAEVRVE